MYTRPKNSKIKINAEMTRDDKCLPQFGAWHSACVCVSRFIVFPFLLSKWRKKIRMCIESMECANACVFVHHSFPWRCLVSCQSILLVGRLFLSRKKPNENCSKVLIPLDSPHNSRLSSSFSVKWNHFSLAWWLIVNARVRFHIWHRMCRFCVLFVFL